MTARTPARLWALALALALLGPAVVGGAQQLGAAISTTVSADGTGADRKIELNVTAVPCADGYDNEKPDDVCLAYDGQIPGPTFVFRKGRTVDITLNHRVWQTVQNTSASAELAEKLVDARYTLHRHGTSVAACEDGVSQPQGTEICDSAIGTNESITYTFETDFPGAWHYHDHALGLDAGVVEGPVLGPPAEHRGLFGSFLVLDDGEGVDRENVFDLHLLDPGPNGGLGLNRTVDVGDRFDIVVVGLGDQAWQFELRDPDGDLVREIETGPGVSRVATVETAVQGTYTWTARSAFVGTFDGEVVAE